MPYGDQAKDLVMAHREIQTARINTICFIFKGAFWGILASQVLGIVRFILDIIYVEPACGENDSRPSIVKSVNGYDFTAIQIAVAFVAIIGISLLTQPLDKSQVDKLLQII